MDEFTIQDDDLLRQVQESTGPFLPVCLCLDTSASMKMRSGGGNGPSRLENVQMGLDSFYERVAGDANAREAVHAAVVTFDTGVRVVRNFSSPASHPAPRLELGQEGTALGAGVNTALDRIEQYSGFLSWLGAERCPPALIVMSDGIDNIGRTAFKRAESRIAEMVEAGRLTVFAFGIGEGASLKRLSQLSPGWQPRRLDENQITQVFNWLVMSTIQISSEIRQFGKSKVGLEHYTPESWGEPLR